MYSKPTQSRRASAKYVDSVAQISSVGSIFRKYGDYHQFTFGPQYQKMIDFTKSSPPPISKNGQFYKSFPPPPMLNIDSHPRLTPLRLC